MKNQNSPNLFEAVGSDQATISLFTCPLFGTGFKFRNVVLLLAIFRLSLNSHFKNSVTHELTANEKREKCFPNGIKIAIFFQKLQIFPKNRS